MDCFISLHKPYAVHQITIKHLSFQILAALEANALVPANAQVVKIVFIELAGNEVIMKPKIRSFKVPFPGSALARREQTATIAPEPS